MGGASPIGYISYYLYGLALCEAGVGSGGHLNNRGITGEGLTLLHNSVGANKRARNRIQQQLTEVSLVLSVVCRLHVSVLRCIFHNFVTMIPVCWLLNFVARMSHLFYSNGKTSQYIYCFPYFGETTVQVIQPCR